MIDCGHEMNFPVVLHAVKYEYSYSLSVSEVTSNILIVLWFICIGCTIIVHNTQRVCDRVTSSHLRENYIMCGLRE